MHRLRGRKKARAEEDALTASNALPFLKKGGKPGPVEEMPKLDLGNALPPSDDFRTSLLMPNLASRFSILKQEQMAGTVSGTQRPRSSGNDYEFAPTRFAGLGDIAETNSISGSVLSAPNSNSDGGRPSEDGSVMGRGRGGEGNVLFGGRQKVYKVASSKYIRGGGSMEDLHSSGPSLGSRAFSPYDLPDSHHQTRKSRDEDGEDKSDTEYNKYRYTASSTNSTPTTMTRTSTAATSINSQPGHSNLIAPPVSSPSLPHSPSLGGKARRPLYEQALDQQLQDQQYSAMSRLETLASLKRVGSMSPPRSSSPVTGLYHVSPTSPTSKQGVPWAPKTASPKTPILPTTQEDRAREDVEAHSPPATFDSFDFGLNISKPSAGSARLAPEGAGIDAKRRSSEIIPPLPPGREPRGSNGDEDRDGRGLYFRGDDEPRSTSLVTASSGEVDQDLMIQQIGEDLDVAARVLSSDSDALSISIPSHPRKSEARASVSPAPLSPRSRGFGSTANTLSPRGRNHDAQPLSPASPGSAAGLPEAAESDPLDSPTIPPTQGLNLLVQQHLRSDSGGSSYAGSTYTRLSRVSRYGVAASIITPTSERKPSESSADNVWEYDNGRDEHPYRDPDSSPREDPHRLPERSEPSHREDGEEDRKGGDDWESARERPASRTGTEPGGSGAGSRPQSRSGNDDEQDLDWDQQLAFRRQIIQQNLRNQEKINSYYEPENSRGGKGAFGGLKSKGSNGFLKGDGGVKAPALLGMGPDGRGRPRTDAPDEESRLRQAVRGPHPVAPVSHLPGQGPPRSRNGSRPPSSGSSSRNPPVTSPRMGQKPFREQARVVVTATGNKVPGRGQPMGWRDPYDPSLAAPSSPQRQRNPKAKPYMPMADGYKDDLSRAMMTGQSNVVDGDASVGRWMGSGAEQPVDGTRSTFNHDQHPSTRRNRGNSNTSPTDVVRMKSSMEMVNPLGPPPRLPPPPTPSGESFSLEPKPPTVSSAPSSSSHNSKTHSLAMEQIQSANAVLQPSKKRAISKNQIGTPMLVSKTSSIPTINLPNRSISVPSRPVSPVTDGRGRRARTNTLFGAFGVSKSTDHIPDMPVRSESDFGDRPGAGGFANDKLRKSTSDGGGLASRARAENVPAMPRIPKAHDDIVAGGMF